MDIISVLSIPRAQPCSRQYLSFHSGAARPPETESIPNLFLHSARERKKCWMDRHVVGESKYARGYLCTRRDKYLRRPRPRAGVSPRPLELNSTICRLALFLSLSRSLESRTSGLALDGRRKIIVEFLRYWFRSIRAPLSDDLAKC